MLDGSVMRREALLQFLAEQIEDAKDKGVLFSVHLKATMMRVSDPIIFGHAVRAFFKDVFEEYGDDLTSVGVDSERRPGVVAKRDRGPAFRRSATRYRRRSTPPTRSGRSSPWSTPTGGSPAFTSPAT